MDESERLQSWKENYGWDQCSISTMEKDEKLSERIFQLLNDPKIDKYCMVDAYYYDYSVIPEAIKAKNNLYRDTYLIYGITTDGEIVSKWVDRWDLDSSDPIVNGECIHPPYDPSKIEPIPEINICFNPNLLSTPVPNLTKLFDRN